MKRYPRYQNESEDAYKYRICAMKEKIGTWNEVAQVINQELNHDFDESAYRKTWTAFTRLAQQSEVNIQDADEILQDIKRQRRELEREKVKMRDERNEVSRLYREWARTESMWELIKRKVEAFEPTVPELEFERITSEDSDMIVLLTDLHIGIEINNKFNLYNEKVLKERLCVYLQKIYRAALMHQCERCHVVIGGDCVSGIIHSSIRLENNENVVDQTMLAAEYISEFLRNVAQWFDYVEVYNVAGNHSRVFANKNDAAKGENLDRMIPFYAKARLQNNTNVHFNENTIDESIGSFDCQGNLVYFVHGDKDSLGNMVQRLTAFTGQMPDLILSGHRHTNGLVTEYGVKVVQSGSVSGMDNFCVDHRMRSGAEQAILIVNKDGLDCMYDVDLDPKN